MFMALKERRVIDISGLAYVLSGRLLGTVGGEEPVWGEFTSESTVSYFSAASFGFVTVCDPDLDGGSCLL